MSNGNIKVNNDSDVVDHTYTHDELVDLVKDMSLYLEKVKTKKKNLKNENLILKKSYDRPEHLLGTIACMHEELKLTHEVLCLKHKKLEKTMLLSLRAFPKKKLKLMKAHHVSRMVNCNMWLTLVL